MAAVAVRINLEKRQVTCSVHDLLPDSLGGGLGAAGEGLARLSVGAELHRTVQGQRASADPHYTTEVSVDARFSIDDWELRVIGRADAITRGPNNRPIVEEIKTLHFRTELRGLFANERLERFRWQARI